MLERKVRNKGAGKWRAECRRVSVSTHRHADKTNHRCWSIRENEHETGRGEDKKKIVRFAVIEMSQQTVPGHTM